MADALIWCVGLVAICCVTGAAAPDDAGPAAAPDVREVLLADHIAVRLPSHYVFDDDTLGDRGAFLAANDGARSLVITVYGGQKPPTALGALKAHTEELLRVAKSDEVPRRIRRAFLGKRRTARDVDFVRGEARHEARVVAASQRGRTVVAAWTWPLADKAGQAALDAIVDGIVSR